MLQNETFGVIFKQYETTYATTSFSDVASD